MSKRIELVSQALRADPPAIRGLIVDGRLHAYLKVRGDGVGRSFKFDLHHRWVPYIDLIRNQDAVALDTPDDAPRLQITFKAKFPFCPGCGAVLPARDFWDHYNELHAVRMWWLNEGHWGEFVRGPYRKPPELE